jgi:hypothetical protein
VYTNVFTDTESETSWRENESDDTASTISTVVDKFSICSETDFSISLSQNPELAKALKPFTLLEQEFNLENKLELLTFKPVHRPEVYENVSLHRDKNYENVIIKTESVSEYENVEIRVPPRPMPRQTAIVEPKKRFNSDSSPIVVPPPRAKTTKLTSPVNEFNTIQTWLQEATEVIHECAIVEDLVEPPIQATKKTLPRLVDAIPKASITKPIVNNNNEGENTVVIKKCIKISASENVENYGESSSDDDDTEKVYRPSHDVFDTYSDEDGEKLGPPEIVGVGGPSEAYFNFPWATPLLPTIGEVEEEMSSLEQNR